MDLNNTILVGYSSGIGAENHDCGLGPAVVMDAPGFQELKKAFNNTYHFKPRSEYFKEQAINEIQWLASQVADQIIQADFFVVLGGDHCSAIGTFSGAAAKYQDQGDLGLIWLDAHLDSHTPQTTHSHNTHGMPLATLLGHGDSKLTQKVASTSPALKPENVCVIGARSYESEEQSLLEQLNVRIFYMDEIKERGLAAVFNDAYAIVNSDTAGFCISFDLDVLDPEDAPGTGVQVADGIRATDMLNALDRLPKDRLLGIDITEFNPTLDVDNKTLHIILDTMKIVL